MSRMTSIAPEALEGVTGGKATPPVKPSTGSSSSGSNDQLLAAVQGIQSSLADIGKNNNGGNNNTLLFMGMALAMQRRNQTTVVYGGGRNYYWQSSW
jgi:hypothetical protein